MSTCVNREISCPHCGAPKKTPMWPSVTADANQELRIRILNETLFDWRCPSCGYQAQLAYPCLYHDRARRYMVCISPRGDALSKINGSIPPTVRNIQKRAVANLTEMKEKILLFEAGMDDVAMEIVKFAVTGVLETKWKTKGVKVYFRSAGAQAIDFAVFRPGVKEPAYQGTRMEVYQQACDVLKALEFHAGAGFLKTDAKLAQELLDAYQDAS